MWSTDRVGEKAKLSQLACLSAKQSVPAPSLTLVSPLRESCNLLGEDLHDQWWELGFPLEHRSLFVPLQ